MEADARMTPPNSGTRGFPMAIDFPFEREAAKNLPMPDSLTLTDQLAFQALSFLYARYNLKKIDRETAMREKRAIKWDWEKRKSLDAFDSKLMNLNASRILKIESSARDFRKAKCVADALEAARYIIEVMDNVPEELSPAVLEELKNAGY